MNKTEYFVKDDNCSKDNEHNCENCKRNACGYCTHFGVNVSKSNDCQNVAKRASNN